MQSLDSSCQEADTIINDTLLKLKGSSLQTGSANSFRQPHILQSSQLQYQTLNQQQSLQQPQLSFLQHSTSSLSGLQPLSHQPPPYLFDGPESPPEFIINEHGLLPSSNSVAESRASLSTPSLLSNINSIISPPSVVPDMLLNTSPTSASLSCLKPEKRALLSPLSSATTNNSHLSNPSSPSKKPKLSTSITYGDKLVSPSTSSSSILQPLLSSSSSLGSNVNSKLSTTLPSGSLSQQQRVSPHHSDSEAKQNLEDKFKSAKVVYSTSLSANPLNQGSSARLDVATTNSYLPSYLDIPSPSSSHSPHAAEGCASSAIGSSPKTSANTSYFDIHDKIRELYLYLLIHDEKGLKESRKRHRTRSFVLERLIDREKLNTIVLNLYPGNKGYSLAFYQDDNQIEALNEAPSSYDSDCIRSTSTSVDGGGGSCAGTTFDSGGISPNRDSMKHGMVGGSISRLKQTQISSKSLNNRNSNNASSSKNDMADLETAIGLTSNLKASANLSDGLNANAAALQSDENTNGQVEKDDDDNLVEVMSWPYEIDDLLNSIDKEELPIFISDLLEARIPNVFYSGCVICQVRDYRQTFPISSNSCDIYHVLLKPTNEMLYSDINQISIDASIGNEDKLLLESQLILATAEPLCLVPDPRIGEYAINSQHRKQFWNTSPLRRQMKKYSQISINRKRKIDQFTHHYGLELCDYLQRIRQRPKPLSSVASSNSDSSRTMAGTSSNTHIIASINKLQKKSNESARPIRTPRFEYPPLVDPGLIDVLRLAKEYPQKNRDTKEDFLPVLIEEYTLESDREYGHVYLIKLSIYKRPATMEYLGELYVDRIHRQGGEHKGESCRFSLGTRAYADRYIDQFTELFTEEGRKAVRITHRVPGQPTNISCTNGYTYQVQSGSHITQQTSEVSVSSQLPTSKQQLQIQPQQQLHQQIPAVASTSQQQPPNPQQQVQHQISANYANNQIITSTINATSPTHLQGNQQLNINLQGGNIVGITSTGSVQQIRQQPQQLFDASGGSLSVQAQSGQQISLSNGSLVLVQQQPTGSSVPNAVTIQTAANNQQKAQLVGNNNQMAITGGTVRSQMTGNVPVLQTQLKAAASLVAGQQQQIIQQKTANVNHTSNSNANAYVTGFMNVTNAFQQPQPQQVQVQQQHTTQNKSTNNAAILSLLNSAPAAMTSTPLGSAFSTNTGTVQQTQTMAQQPHQTISAEQLLQQPPRKTNEVIQSLLSNNLRKINMANTGNQTVVSQNRSGNLIAVGIPSDGNTSQNVRVTMSALASQLASPPALMTNSNFGFTASSANNSNNVSLGSNNIKILNNTGQRIISTSSLRRDSLITAVPSPGSDSNASNTSGASTLGFAMPGLNALLATSPSSNSDQSQVQPHGNVGVVCSGNNVGNMTTSLTNQTLFERLNSSSSGSITNNTGLPPPQPANVTKNLVQNTTNVQSPATSISPLSSPPPQPSPQQVQVQQTTQTTTLNLQGIDFQSLQGAMATFPGLQNVQVQIPISLSNTPLAAASGIVSNAQRGGQQATSLLVSVPVTNTTQVNTMQTVPGGCGTIVSAVPATGAATQTVVLTNAGSTGNPQGSSMLSLPIAQLFASVKGLNPQNLRNATVTGGSVNNVINTNIIQASNANGNLSNTSGSNLPGAVNISNPSAATSIQLVGTLQQRPRSIQVLGTKQISNRTQLPQRNITNASKMTGPTTAGPSQMSTAANLSASPLVMATQKLQLKLQKQNTASLQQSHQQQAQSSLHSQQQQLSQQHIQLGGTALSQNLSAAAIAANQKRRRSATDVNK